MTRKGGSPDRLRLARTEAEREAIGQYASQYVREITDLLGRIPRPLLLLLKTNDCLRRAAVCVVVMTRSPLGSLVDGCLDCACYCAGRTPSKSRPACPRRAVDVELGAPVSNFVVTARECTRALARERRRQGQGLRSTAAVWLESIRLEARLAVLRLLAWMARPKAAGADGGGGGAAAA